MAVGVGNGDTSVGVGSGDGRVGVARLVATVGCGVCVGEGVIVTRLDASVGATERVAVEGAAVGTGHVSAGDENTMARDHKIASAAPKISIDNVNAIWNGVDWRAGPDGLDMQ
jgi:hypothetical protein